MSGSTMEAVARAAGVHRTTVSLALRDHPRIPAATRDRIKAVADQLGYRPNPLISALMKFRATNKKPAWHNTLGILTSGPTADSWKQPRAYGQMLEGAVKRADELGYRLQTFWADDPKLPIQRFNTMLRTRNIPGCIVAPLIAGQALPDIEWAAFSAVAIGYSLQHPDLHRVSSDYYHAMQMAVDRCCRAGLQRIGLALEQSSDNKVDHLWLAAFLMEQRLRGVARILEPFILKKETDNEKTIESWLARDKPDVVISLPRSMMRMYLQRRRRAGRQLIRWVSLGCYDRGEADPGVYQNYPLIGAAAVDFLVGLVNRGERGIPKQSHIMLIKGEWNEGTTGALTAEVRGDRGSPKGQSALIRLT